jgi:hypothetical protein
VKQLVYLVPTSRSFRLLAAQHPSAKASACLSSHPRPVDSLLPLQCLNVTDTVCQRAQTLLRVPAHAHAALRRASRPSRVSQAENSLFSVGNFVSSATVETSPHVPSLYFVQNSSLVTSEPYRPWGQQQGASCPGRNLTEVVLATPIYDRAGVVGGIGYPINIGLGFW